MQRAASSFLKEVTYTSQSREGLSQANRLIKELQKRHRMREQERKEQEVRVCGVREESVHISLCPLMRVLFVVDVHVCCVDFGGARGLDLESRRPACASV